MDRDGSEIFRPIENLNRQGMRPLSRCSQAQVSGRWCLLPVSVEMQRWLVGSPHRCRITTSRGPGPSGNGTSMQPKAPAYADNHDLHYRRMLQRNLCGSGKGVAILTQRRRIFDEWKRTRRLLTARRNITARRRDITARRRDITRAA